MQSISISCVRACALCADKNAYTKSSLTGRSHREETKKRSHRAGSEPGAHAPFFTKSLALSWIVFASPSVTSSPSSSSAAAPTG